ncbi:PKD domain-containing protein, partial [Psychroflexus planctonicus]|uniref:PKD domain-containing protein n=1 Tax=Psychroflexus planctonicus TaxID=1526575 RepID=UPI00166A8BDC
MKYILLFISLISLTVNAQTNIIDIIDGDGFASVSSCEDSFFINNEDSNLSGVDIVFTICPDDDTQISTLDFTAFNIPSLIDFTIYDGDDITANEIPYDGSLGLVSASDADDNPTGCLTIQIESNFVPAFISAEIAFDAGCREPCEDIPSTLVSLQPSTFNATTGNYEVGDFIPVTIEVDHEGLDNESYTYEWDFGDGETATTDEPFVQHAFEAVLEYTVQVTVIDQFGCETLNTDLASVEVISRTSDSCADAQPFCAGGELFFFPNINNQTPGGATSAEPGPDYGCLGSQPYPAWFYMEVEGSGDFEFLLEQDTSSDFNNPTLDVDFIIWGPFDSPEGNCDNLTSANEVDCSFSAAPIEDMTIPNAQDGDFYIVLITNYNQSPGFISFQQTNAGEAGAGVSGCPILGDDVDLCVGEEYTITSSLPADLVSDQIQYVWEIFNEDTEEFEVIPDEDESTLVVESPGGTYRLTATNPISGTYVDGTIDVNYFDSPAFQNEIEDVELCEEELEDAEVNLNEVGVNVDGINQDDLSISFYTTEADALDGTSPIINPEAYQPANELETIFVRIQNDLLTSCSSISSFDIITTILNIGEPLVVEPIDPNDPTFFDLTENDDIVLDGQSLDDVEFAYFETEEDALNYENPIADPSNYDAGQENTAFVAIRSLENLDCILVRSFELFACNEIEIEQTIDLNLCGDFSFTETFDLTQNNLTSMEVNDPDDVESVQYFLTEADAENEVNEITNATNYQLPEDIQTQDIYVLITRTQEAGGCSSVFSFEINLFNVQVANPLPTIDECQIGESGEGLFNLTQQNGLVLGANQPAADYSISYFEEFADANGGVNPIVDPTAFESAPQEIWVRIDNVNSVEDCFAIDSFQIDTIETTDVNLEVTPLEACDENNDGFFSGFDLASRVDEINFLEDPEVQVSFHPTASDAETGQNPLASPYANVEPSQQTLYVRIFQEIEDLQCVQTTTLDLFVYDSPLLEEIEPIIACDTNETGIQFFDLTQVEEDLFVEGQNTEDFEISYHLSENAANNNSGLIGTPTAYQNQTSPQTVYVRVSDPASPLDCYNIEPIELIVDPLPEITPPTLLAECDDVESGSTTDETSSFDLSQKIEEITNANNALEVVFYANESDQENN